jgi:hypothetical protein
MGTGDVRGVRRPPRGLLPLSPTVLDRMKRPEAAGSDGCTGGDLNSPPSEAASSFGSARVSPVLGFSKLKILLLPLRIAVSGDGSSVTAALSRFIFGDSFPTLSCGRLAWPPPYLEEPRSDSAASDLSPRGNAVS